MNRPRRIAGLDALRILAAFAVLICHLVAYWDLQDLPLKLPELLSHGAHGVDVFIVLSGFVLSLPVFATGRDLAVGNFLRRRATRILPPYYVALAFAAVIALSPAARLIVGDRATWGDLAWHAAVLQTWTPSRIGSINGSLWSVALEVQLYAVMPLLLLAARRWGMSAVLLAAAALSVGLSAVEVPGAFGAGLTDEHNLPIRLVQFVAGMACARLVVAQRVPTSRLLWPVLLVGTVLAMGATTADVRIGQMVLWAIPSSALVLVTAGYIGAGLGRTRLERWGLGAYSFYLLHQPIVLLLGKAVTPHIADDRLGLVVGVVLCVPAVALPAWVMYLVIERPVHRFGQARFPVLKPPQTRVPAE